MEPASRGPGTALAGVISDAADLAASAAGTSLEPQVLVLYGRLLDAAEEDLREARGSDPGQDTAVALVLLASAILQGRAVLAFREQTAAALDAARRSGFEEALEEARGSQPGGGGNESRRGGLPALRAVTLRTA